MSTVQPRADRSVRAGDGEAREDGEAASLRDCLASYLAEIAAAPVLTPTEERELARRAADGDAEARRRLISANLRLVVKVARRYAAYGLPLCDLIQEGNLGLIKAVERFDCERGTRFSTYAAYWIREGILGALTAGGRAVRLSGHAFKRFQQLTAKAQALAGELLREPTLGEIAAALDTSAQRVARVLSAAAFPVPLEDVPSAERHPTPLEEIACECGCDPAELVRSDPPPDQIRRAVDTLNPRERWVIVHSFGFDGATPRKLREMAQTLGVSVERVRQLREQALARLRRYLADTAI